MVGLCVVLNRLVRETGEELVHVTYTLDGAQWLAVSIITQTGRLVVTFDTDPREWILSYPVP